MKTKKKEIFIGLTVLITIILFFWGTNFIQGKNIFRKGAYYYVVYDNAKGLSTSHKVIVNGFTIGKVDDITLHPDNSGRLLVKLYISEKMQMPKETTAEIVGGILGSTVVELHLPENPNGFLENNDTLISNKNLGVLDLLSSEDLGGISTNAQDILMALDSILSSLQTVLNEETILGLQSSFSNLDTVLNNLSSTTASIDGIVSNQQYSIESMLYNLNVISAALGDKSGEIARAIDNFTVFSDSLSTLNIAELNSAVDEVNETINAINTQQGTLGELVYNKSLYENLNESTRQLNILIEDIKENPSNYVTIKVFGGKDKNKKEE